MTAVWVFRPEPRLSSWEWCRETPVRFWSSLVPEAEPLLQDPRLRCQKQRDHLLVIFGRDDDHQRVAVRAARVADRFLRAHPGLQRLQPVRQPPLLVDAR